MKKLLTLSATFLSCCAAISQGTMNFANASTTGGFISADRQVRFSIWAQGLSPSLTPGTLVSSNHALVNLSWMRVALVYAPTTVTRIEDFALATFSGDYPTFRASTSAVAGSWYSKTATMAGVGPGETVNCAAIVWDVRFSATPPLEHNIRYSMFWGMSDIFSYTVPSGDIPAPGEFLPQNLRGFQVPQVPEPSSATLILFGMLLWGAGRRR